MGLWDPHVGPLEVKAESTNNSPQTKRGFHSRQYMNSWQYSCLSLPSNEITVMYHITQLRQVFV